MATKAARAERSLLLPSDRAAAFALSMQARRRRLSHPVGNRMLLACFCACFEGQECSGSLGMDGCDLL
jgi:hypothetical protein